MKIDLDVKVRLGPLRKFSKELRKELTKELDKAAVNMMTKAIARAPRKTGSLQKSIFVITPLRNTSRKAAAMAKAFNPKAVITGASFSGKADLTIVIGSRVAHAVFVEFGTVRQAAQPFLNPTIRDFKGSITRRWNRVVKKAADAANRGSI